MILTLIGSASLAMLASSEPAPAVEPLQASSASFAIRAARIRLGDGTILEDGVVLVDGKRISAVGRGVELPSGVSVIEHDGDLTAGLVAPHSYTGAANEVSDSTRAFLPRFRTKYVYDPDHSDFRRALEAGITTVLLTPGVTNVAGGLTAAVKTHGDRVLAADNHLHLSLHTTALWGWREPTSWPGAMAALEEWMAAETGPFADVAAGRLPVILEAWDRHEVARALDFARRHELTGALRGGHRAGELADGVAESGLAVIVGPFGADTDHRRLDSVRTLSDAGVPITFGLDSPFAHPEALRLSAALCLRRGLDPAVAWSGLTTTAATVAGVGDKVGRIERGFDADLVLWSGDPLELSSRVVAVWVDGALAYGGVQ